MIDNIKTRKPCDIIDLFLVGVFCFSVPVVYFFTQDRVLAGNGFGWDGLEYYKIYNIFIGVGSDYAIFPFCNRVAAPFLASLIPLPIFESLEILNLFFSIAIAVLAYFLSSYLGYNKYISVFCSFLATSLFFAPARFSVFYPMLSDCGFIFFSFIAMHFIVRKKFIFAYFAMAPAFLFREAAIYTLPLIFLAEYFLSDRGFDFSMILKLFSAILVLLIIKYLISYEYGCSGGQLSTGISWVRKKLTDPGRLIGFSSALLMTAAPLIFLKREKSGIFYAAFSALVLAAILAMAGGSDSTRIFYSFLPFYIPLFCALLQQRSVAFAVISIIGFVCVNSVGSKILEPLNYMPNKDEAGYFSQYPDYSSVSVSVSLMVVWVVLYFFLFCVFDRVKNSINKEC